MQYGSCSRSRPALLALILLASGAGSAAALPQTTAPAQPASAQPSPPQLAVNGLFSDYLVGTVAIAGGDMETAAAELRRAQMLDPASRPLLLQAFLASVLAGRQDATELALKLPGFQAAEMMLANDAALKGDWAQAESRFKTLSRVGLNEVLQPLMVAWSQQGAGRTDDALATLRPYETGQRRGVYLLHAALIQDLAGHTAECGPLYRNARASYGGLNLRLAQILASWNARQGNTPKAEGIIRDLVETAPELSIAQAGLDANLAQRPVTKATDGLAETYLALAASMRQQDSTDTAQLMLSFALQLRPDFTPARLLMANLQEQQKRYATALKSLAPVPANDPLIALVRLRRAALMNREGQSDAALKELAQLAHDAPGNPAPLMQQGDILREHSRFKEAVQAYTAAIERIKHPSREDWSVFYARAIAYDGAHDWPHAEADLEHAMQLSPDQPSVINYLGFSLTEQNRDLPRARALLEKAAQEQPNEGDIVDSLGWVMLHQGQTEDAIETLERAVELDPEDPVINSHLGDAYDAAARKLDAVYQWERALTFHPTPEDSAALDAKLRKADPALLSKPRQDAQRAAPAGAPREP